MADMVNHPRHYKSAAGLEVIDVIEAFTEGLEGGEATNTGNVLKYICRWKKKNGLEDLKKARWYLNRLIDSVEMRTENDTNDFYHVNSDGDLDGWETVLASLDDGSYKTRYAVGDTQLLDLGDEGVIRIRLVGIDKDDLADGSGKAKMSWVADDLLVHDHPMTNPDGDRVRNWEKSEMRTYLKETIKPLIPETIQGHMAIVAKNQPYYDEKDDKPARGFTQDDIWIPSYDEIFSPSGLYRSAFPDKTSRIKRKPDSASASSWWLRSAYYTYYFHYVISDGDWRYNGANYSNGVALGFCLN